MQQINKNNKNNKGQIAIIVLIVSAIVLTLGLSASKQTVTDTKVDTDEVSLKEAFNTAESGINNYLNGGGESYTTTGSNAIVNFTPIGGDTSISSEGVIPANKNQLFWLVNHTSTGGIGTDYYGSNSVKLCVSDSSFSGALKIDYFYVNGGAYKVKRWGYNFGGGSVVNGFNPNTSSCIDTVDLSAGSPLLISITPLGSATSLTISGSSPFPSQGEDLTSIGTVTSGVKTQVKTRYAYQIPSFLLDSLTAVGKIE
jgi:hypothetical protein